MRSSLSRRTLWIPLALLAVAAPASVLTVAFWPQDQAARQPTARPAAPAGSVVAVRDLDEIRELRLLTAAEPTPASRPAAAPQPSPETAPVVPQADAVVAEVAPAPAVPAGGSVSDSRGSAGSDGSSDAVARERAMSPAPRPPLVDTISPDIQQQIDEAENGPGIDLGTLVPEP
ncbi:hypothetical protein [Prauserella cavernicola]|uniref:Uncharacterized protein n=1 Tax=Prauserella cavernicola TaxID=2800127 RepID=A0A934QU77_9PSEU|nr:hypothetical protein [Prauserella cavernicola]MBK1786681.1 hypothetical protein [Prauserella cavernicola]